MLFIPIHQQTDLHYTPEPHAVIKVQEVVESDQEFEALTAEEELNAYKQVCLANLSALVCRRGGGFHLLALLAYGGYVRSTSSSQSRAVPLKRLNKSLFSQLTKVKTMLKLFWPLLRHSTTVDKLCWKMAKNKT